MAAGRGRGGRGGGGGHRQNGDWERPKGAGGAGDGGPERVGGLGLGGARFGGRWRQKPGIKWRPRRASPGGRRGAAPASGGPTKRPRYPSSYHWLGRLEVVLFGPGLAYLRAGPRRARQCGAEGASPQTTPSAVLSGRWVPGFLGPSGGDARERLARCIGPRGRGLALFFLFLCFGWRYCCPWQTERESKLSSGRDRVHDTSLPKENAYAFIMW